jgi:cellulose synthase/poly-beta-1,6-N-acetylglucosamine synthase-like glycosyltransferase
MNYCLDFSLRVEDEILRLMTEQEQRNQADPFMTTQEQNGDNPFEIDDDFYEQALHTMLQKDQGRTWANGNIRLGDIILIVDSDTRVPETCLYMGALEMLECPDIAIVQHTSGVLKVGKNIFEAGISYLTDLVYTTSAFNVSSGDCPCFVGHNAFVRWKALQSVSFEEDNVHKFWSESHVSEDLHLSMRLQIAGFEIRMASYHGEEFKEGVSVTVFDEVARWQKYAYGTNELIFNPIRYWHRGPFTSLYVQYLLSGVKPATKISLISYTFTYYALAMALPLALLNYFLFGLWPDTLDQFFVASWKALVVILSIFYVIVSSPLYPQPVFI